LQNFFANFVFASVMSFSEHDNATISGLSEIFRMAAAVWRRCRRKQLCEIPGIQRRQGSAAAITAIGNGRKDAGLQCKRDHPAIYLPVCEFFTGKRESKLRHAGVPGSRDSIHDNSEDFALKVRALSTNQTKMNVLGKLPESLSVRGKIGYVGLLKVLRVGLITAGAALVGFLITALPGFDFMPESTVDTTIVTLFLVPRTGGASSLAS
jgi:hypothetical protein